MKKLSSMLVVLLTLIVSTGSWARDHERGHDRGHRGPGGDGIVAMEMVGHMHRALKQLDLTEAQETAIKAEFKAMKEELKPLAEALRDNRAALHQLLMADEYDEVAVAQVADEQGAITADMIRLAGGTIHSAMSQLTEEQVNQLNEMREERRQRMKKHIGQLQKKLERMESGS